MKEGLQLLAKMLRLDKDQLTKEVGSVAPFLIPFLKMSCVYFVLDLPDQSSFTAAFVKALPILSLIWLVCLQGVGLGKPSSHYTMYNRRILCGLILSCIGDVTLVWQKEKELYFIIGMLCFACAQTCYIIAFGFSPFGLKEMIPCFLGCLVIVISVFPCLPPGILSFAVPVYALLIATLNWRSLARFTLRGDIPWRKIFSAVGAFLFTFSDVVLVINKFCFPVPFEHMLVMGTYFGAQLCLALSVINSHLHGNEVHSSGVVAIHSSSVPPHSSQRQRKAKLSVEANS